MMRVLKGAHTLCFDRGAEAAVEHYLSIFRPSRLLSVTHYTEKEKKWFAGPVGSVRFIAFEILGQKFLAVNGGSFFQSNDSASFVVNCETQREIDFLWEQLSSGGEKQECGWLKDRFGVSWQIVPSMLSELLRDSDPVRSERVIQAVYQMEKMDIAALKSAAGLLN